MTYEFKLPDIGEGVVEGEVVRWLVKEGDPLREDQPMVEIMTDKATVEIPAPRAGHVGKRMFNEGQLCPVGKVLITIELAEGDTSGTAKPQTGLGAAAKAPSSAPAMLTASAAASSSNGNGGARSVLATPATRRLARDIGVDIGQVIGTGPSGRITSDDVREHQSPAAVAVSAGATASSSSPSSSSAAARLAPVAVVPQAGDVRVPFRGVRRKIAEHLVHSKHTAAHFTYVEEIDCTDLAILRARANEKLGERGVKLSFLPFIIKATVAALQKFPQLNATLDEAAGEIVQRRSYHIGLATATEAGLIVPVVRDADRRSLVDLAQEIDRLAEATRTGKASREQLSGSTFTISSLGPLGGVMATPIINFPEVAIMAPAKISQRPAVRDGAIVIRDLMNMSISVDHRVVDGHEAAQFLANVKASLETPGLLFLESI